MRLATDQNTHSNDFSISTIIKSGTSPPMNEKGKDSIGELSELLKFEKQYLSKTALNFNNTTEH